MTTATHKEKKGLSAVTYLRVASGNLVDQERGLAAQREACKREAERLGAVITEELVDLRISAEMST